MKIINTSENDNFKIFKNANELVEVVYSNAVNTKAKAIYKGNEISIKPNNFKDLLFSRFSIYKNDLLIGQIHKKNFWSAHRTIHWTDEAGSGRSYTLCVRNHDKFELLDDANNSMLKVYTDFSLREFKTLFELELSTNIPQEEALVDLLIYTIFSVQYYQFKNPDTSAV